MIEKNLLKFEAEGRELAKFLRSLEQFIQTVKGQNVVFLEKNIGIYKHAGKVRNNTIYTANV